MPAFQRQVENVLGYVSAAAVAAMMIITTMDVGARFFLGAYLPGSYEYVSLLFVLVIYLGLTLAQRDDSHIAISILYDKLPRGMRKTVQAVWLLALLLLIFPLAWYSWLSTWDNYVLGDTILGIKPVVTWPARLTIAIGLTALSLRVVVQLSALLAKDELIDEGVEGGTPPAAKIDDREDGEST